MRVLLLLVFLLTAISAAGQHLDTWRGVADKLVTTRPESVEFNWGEGVQMSGLMQAWERTRNDRYADFVEQWAAYHMPKGIETLLGNQADSKRKGYCGYWVCGTALAYLYEARKKPEHLQTAREIVAFIRAGAMRSPEGAAAHWQGNFQIWVDTLNMICPLLSRLSRLDNKPEYLDDAVNQLLVSARHMQEPKTKLFFHVWDWQEDKHSEILWGRGNGWVVMSLADSFEFLPKSHRQHKELKSVAERLAGGLVNVQDREGLWHTVIDDTQSYAECSATTMIVYGLLKLVRLGVLPARYRAPAVKAWSEVNARWIKDGVVIGVSGGTGPGDKASYLKRPVGTFTWGTGSYLLAGAEIARFR